MRFAFPTNCASKLLLILANYPTQSPPLDKINKALGTELNAGKVVLSGATQVHAERRHPEDYPSILPHLGAILANPLYAGDDFKNKGKFEIIGTAPGLAGYALIAISFEPVATSGSLHWFPSYFAKLNMYSSKLYPFHSNFNLNLSPMSVIVYSRLFKFVPDKF
eukprot:gene19537-19972_t